MKLERHHGACVARFGDPLVLLPQPLPQPLPLPPPLPLPLPLRQCWNQICSWPFL